ncbi:MAG TPA: TrmH family RNA methyltransferase, partial [Acidobacteriota bacterium]|nr:TrmH family RNA methyltransferase [Acidobacteriota bacterium]
IRIVTADAKAPMLFSEYDWTQPTLLWLGSEGNGLPNEALQTADTSVRIPMAGQLESLNITVATAILLYEAARQRTSLQAHIPQPPQGETLN